MVQDPFPGALIQNAHFRTLTRIFYFKIFFTIFQSIRNQIFKMLRLFCSFIIAVSSLQVDCEDGKRGGCQHTCYQNQCRCPKCWTLDENGLDCVPEQDKVKINCSPSGIAVLVSECVIPGERTLGLRDFNVSKCQKNLYQTF